MGFQSKIEHTCDICGFHQVVYNSYPPPSGYANIETRDFTQISSKSAWEYDRIVCSKCIEDSLTQSPPPSCQPEGRTIWKGF